jgi:hypothetical protein
LGVKKDNKSLEGEAVENEDDYNGGSIPAIPESSQHLLFRCRRCYCRSAPLLQPPPPQVLGRTKISTEKQQKCQATCHKQPQPIHCLSAVREP